MTATSDIFQQTVEQFLSDLSGKNRSSLTIRCYSIDVAQFLNWIAENDLTVETLADITKSHLSEYLSSLSDQGLSGRTRAETGCDQGVLPLSGWQRRYRDLAD